MKLERENGSHATVDYEAPLRDFSDNPHVLMFEATPSACDEPDGQAAVAEGVS